MRAINWSALGPVLVQVMFNLTLVTLAIMFFGTFVLKYFVRNVPLLSHAYIFFWAMFRVMVVVVVCTFIVEIFDIQVGPISGGLSFIGMGAVGTLITREYAKKLRPADHVSRCRREDNVRSFCPVMGHRDSGLFFGV